MLDDNGNPIVGSPDFTFFLTFASTGNFSGTVLSTSTTATTDNGATDLNASQVVTITVTTGETETVTGTPTLELSNKEVATYTGGSGTDTLTFSYTVQRGDDTPDLLVTGLNLPNGATIENSAGNPLTDVAQDLGLQIDTTPPTVAVSISNTDVNVAHDTGTVTFTFSQAPVDFALTDVTAPDGTLSHLIGSGTTYTATFTAKAGVDDPKATVSVTSGSYHDADGNAGTGGSTAPFTVDTVTPTVTSITTSGAGITVGSGDLDAGKKVLLTVDFSEKVTVSGHPVLKLNDGGVASYVSGSGTSSLKFSYTVAGGQNTADLTVTGLTLLGGATIKDAAGNNALLTGAVTNPVGVLQIDTKAPTIKSVTTSGAGITAGNGDLDAGKVVMLTVDFSEKVTVTGLPVLKLNDGGLARYVSGSGTAALTFAYRVAAGQNTADLTVTGVTLAGGATIKDAAGNNAILSGAITNPPGVLQIHTKAPTIRWIGASGDWSTASDWSTGTVPGPSDKAVIAAPGSYTVTSSADETVYSLNILDKRATLFVTGASNFATTNGVNDGTIIVDSGSSLSISNFSFPPPGSFENSGKLEATNTNNLPTGGSLNFFRATITNTPKGIIEANGANTEVVVGAATTIVGGTLETQGANAVISLGVGGAAILDGTQPHNPVNIEGNVAIVGEHIGRLAGTIYNSGVITMESGIFPYLICDGNVTLEGGGDITMTNPKPYLGLAPSIFGGVLTNVDNTISGTGVIGQINEPGGFGPLVGTFINEARGVIDANDASGPLVIAGVGPDTNAGLVEATKTGTLLIEGVTIDNFLHHAKGTVEAGHNSTVGLEDATITGGFVKALSGSMIEADQGSNTITGAEVKNDGTIGAEGG